ncbi:MAG TPA: HAMP domain-containing sensor histidine kinase, partial [Actinomycetota bacterium]|nr:HAMP domain-containing sensor histidine kinase [Actinomycetota bacterium]
MSLRLRLLTGLAALVFVGLVVFGTTTYLSVEHILRNRLDGQLTDASRGLTKTGAGQAVGHGIPPGEGDGGNRGPGSGGPPMGSPEDELAARNAAGPELFVEFLTPGGAVWRQFPAEKPSGGVAPALPASVLARVAGYRPLSSEARAAPPVVVGPFSAPPASGGLARAGAERVAVALPPNGGGIVVAGSLKPMRDTLMRLLEVEVGVGLGVLALTLGLGLALARQAARPLEEIAATADAIAAGDLDRRVPSGRERSETGRVALAFNTMLGRIQEAFVRRDATEARLRTFVADASHELSTPLTSIRGYAELFHRGLQSRPEDLAKALERIEQEATRMGILVDELLTLASFDAGRPLGQDPVDLRSIAADAAADLRAVDPERPVALEAAQPVIVVGDESRLRQV